MIISLSPRSYMNGCQGYIYIVSLKSEYTPHISTINLVYIFKGQYYRNETWMYCSSQCATCIAVNIYCPLKRAVVALMDRASDL